MQKLDYPPLLKAGFHQLTMSKVRNICVDSFPLSTKRDGIMKNLEHVHSELTGVGIKGDLWIDGSFVTEKIQPNDVDLLLNVDLEFLNNRTIEQEKVLMWYINDDLRMQYQCDSYFLANYPNDHPLCNLMDKGLSYWKKLFGYSNNQDTSNSCN